MDTVNVECTGEFDLLDIANGAEIKHGGPREVENTWFVRSQLELGQLKLVEDKPKPAAKAK